MTTYTFTIPFVENNLSPPSLAAGASHSEFYNFYNDIKAYPDGQTNGTELSLFDFMMTSSYLNRIYTEKGGKEKSAFENINRIGQKINIIFENGYSEIHERMFNLVYSLKVLISLVALV